MAQALESFGEKVYAEIRASEIRLEKRLEVKFDIKLERMERSIDDHAQQYNSEILTRFDTWASALEMAHIDRELTSNKLENHEKRIEHLEKIFS